MRVNTLISNGGRVECTKREGGAWYRGTVSYEMRVGSKRLLVSNRDHRFALRPAVIIIIIREGLSRYVYPLGDRGGFRGRRGFARN